MIGFLKEENTKLSEEPEKNARSALSYDRRVVKPTAAAIRLDTGKLLTSEPPDSIFESQKYRMLAPKPELRKAEQDN